jgi:hypothetical protein
MLQISKGFCETWYYKAENYLVVVNFCKFVASPNQPPSKMVQLMAAKFSADSLGYIRRPLDHPNTQL